MKIITMIRLLKSFYYIFKMICRNEPIAIWRKTNGKYFCDGDCRSWDIGICTCGLYHVLKVKTGFPSMLDWNNIQFKRQNETLEYLTFNMLEINEFCPHEVHINQVCEQCVADINVFLESLS